MSDALVKTPHSKTAYTKAQLGELVKCGNPDNGHLHFIENYFQIQHPTKGSMKLKPFDFQYGLIDSYHNYRSSISLVSRQMGKSTIAAAYLLWYAMFVPDSMILIVSNKHDGAKEIMHRIRYGYENCPDYVRSGVVAYNKHSIEFDNGSRIVAQATTENSGRGLSISLVYMDEFAFVQPRIAKEFWTALSPTLSTGGKCIITSTPNNDEDQFSEIWRQANKLIDDNGNERPVGINGFRPYFADWREHPDRDEDWYHEEFNKIGEERFKREHENQFISFDETLISPKFMFDWEHIDPLYKEGTIRWFNTPAEGMDYVVALDPSMGTGGDFAAIQVIELPSMEQIAEWQSKRTIIEKQVGMLRHICETLDEAGANEIYWSLENNTLGEAGLSVIRAMGEENIPGIFVSAQGGKRKGFTLTNRSKLEYCAKMKSWIESDTLQVFSKFLIGEFKTFVSSGATYKAKDGNHDDLVLSLLLAVRIIDVISKWDDEIMDAVTGYMDEESFEEPMPLGIL
tara:strand:- start:179356 stop:180891 length:1536 start_codon:yes stop_codon:yes gene_type:complete